MSTLSFDPDSGLLEIVLADLPKRVVRWVDPSTDQTAAPPWSKRPAPSLASLPVGEAGFRADLLRPLRGLERPGRQLLRPRTPRRATGAPAGAATRFEPSMAAPSR